MANKRAAGEGTYGKRADGRWEGRISLGLDSKGAQVRKSRYGKTQKEVREKCEALRKEYESGLTTDKIGTVAEYLVQWIANDIRAGGLNDKTAHAYEDVCLRYINPYIGRVALRKLTSAVCRQWQGQLVREGYSNSKRKKSLMVLGIALTTAVRHDVIIRNPLVGVPVPKVTKREITPLEPEQCERLFAKSEPHRLGDVIILATMTGLRKGEIFALQWGDVNLRERVLTVRKNLEDFCGRLRVKKPKTVAGRRAVVLDTIASEAIERRMKKADDEGFDISSQGIMFCNQRGGYLRSPNFDRNVWYPIREAAGIPKTVRFHDLRHTQASLMLSAGIHPKIVQERLGHANIGMTLNTYSHLMAGIQSESVEKMSAMIPRKKVKV